ncbi:MAG: hypothetical protein E7Z79_02330 [Methanobrevibacter thaueri]|uniref:Uncharacterized protein n=1 Tax=Methanobrevibacter thaueri TaxID=190975 RepID=A0A8T3V8R5_9EURY|nr:hypothetical protein [Methanobrevibacter thaueri]MBE6501260.1 hypothetical protein [Methanobrevibacter thaueri]
MTLTTEETLFVEFLQSFPQFYKKAHEIAENTKGISILPMENGENEFKMYALDDICHSCNIFREGNLSITPKTTDAIWYKKVDGNFFIFLIEFKGDLLCRNSSKCTLVEVVENLKNKNYNDELEHELFLLDKVLLKYSDRMLNGLAAKPLETVTIALPLIYEEYYEKNKDNVDFLDIRNFLKNSRIVYRVVSISEDYEPNRQRTRSRSYRCSNIIPSVCKQLARERHDRELESSYESSLQTYYRRYERAGIVYSAGFVDNIAFNNFIENYLK